MNEVNFFLHLDAFNFKNKSTIVNVGRKINKNKFKTFLLSDSFRRVIVYLAL